MKLVGRLGLLLGVGTGDEIISFGRWIFFMRIAPIFRTTGWARRGMKWYYRRKGRLKSRRNERQVYLFNTLCDVMKKTVNFIHRHIHILKISIARSGRWTWKNADHRKNERTNGQTDFLATRSDWAVLRFRRTWFNSVVDLPWKVNRFWTFQTLVEKNKYFTVWCLFWQFQDV